MQTATTICTFQHLCGQESLDVLHCIPTAETVQFDNMEIWLDWCKVQQMQNSMSFVKGSLLWNCPELANQYRSCMSWDLIVTACMPYHDVVTSTVCTACTVHATSSFGL